MLRLPGTGADYNRARTCRSGARTAQDTVRHDASVLQPVHVQST